MNITDQQSDFFIAYVLDTGFKEFAKELKTKKVVPVRADYDGWISAWVVRLQEPCIPKGFKQHNHG